MKCDVIINGAAGRMGKRLIALAAEDEQLNVVGATERQGHPEIGKDAGAVGGIGQIGVEIGTQLPVAADCVIDFSLPEATDAVIDHCAANKIALVLATTGLSEAQTEKLADASGKIAIVHASNMSVGMNVLFSMAGKVAKMLGGEYDIEITEAHHRFKKDSPSGSALTLARNIACETGRDFPGCLVHGRSGKDTLRQKGAIGMHAIRAGDITGQHSVIFGTIGETVTLSHNAHNRDTFAQGALRAAKWLIGREPGPYSMADVLGLTEE